MIVRPLPKGRRTSSFLSPAISPKFQSFGILIILFIHFLELMANLTLSLP